MTASRRIAHGMAAPRYARPTFQADAGTGSHLAEWKAAPAADISNAAKTGICGFYNGGPGVFRNLPGASHIAITASQLMSA